jgi:Protein of unknown function (DUF1592)/Protein of unknown function (DUF1588)/Protein of unknown function (DUF1585)/Protein of unknown function (DUF1595)
MHTGTRTLIMATLLTAGCSDGDTIANGSAPAMSGSGLPGMGAMGPDPTGMGGPVATDSMGMPIPTVGPDGMPVVPSGEQAPNVNPTASVVPTVASTGGPTPATPPAKTCAPGVPGTSQIARLTNAQYNRTVYDLLGATAPGLLATEQVGGISAAIWDGYHLSADTIAAQVMADPALKSNFMKCTPEGDGEECLKSTIQEFGRRAFRRPLSVEETAGFEDLVTRGAELTPTGEADEVAELILSSFLKMPSFLQRAEITETAEGTNAFKLSSHEVAARLSYMLWGTTPDSVLSAAADNDELQTKAQVLAQAQRMVADEKARDVAAEFHRKYLHLGPGTRWDAAKKDAVLFPLFRDDVVFDMIVETEMLFDNVFTSGGTFQDLLTTNTGYVTSRTAPLYGLEASDFGTTPEPVEFTAEQQRPGFMTRIGWLAAHSNQTRNSPIIRGAFITKDVIGIDPGAPDPEAANTPLPMDPQYDTNRKRVEAQTSAIACAGCHEAYINPPGFVMEAFDASGVRQTTEKDTGAAIDSTGQISFTVGGTPVTVANPAELMAALSASKEAQRFYAERWVGYALERELTGPDQCTVDMMATNAAAGSYPIQTLLTDLTQSDSFLVRALEVTQ